MSKYSLIPGLESFMEDTEVNVEVAVGEPDEVAEEVVETSEAAEDAGAVTEEAEATEEQAEMIFAQFAELEHRYNHVKKYGVDRTFMRLFNSKGELERAFRISLPSCESFDATGDRYSPESKACMEGLGDAVKKVWEFLKNLCVKVARFFGRIADFIRVRFGNLDKQIGRLRDFLKNRVDDSEGLKNSDRKVYGLDDIEKCIKAINERITIDSNGVVAIKQYQKLEDYNSELVKRVSARDTARSTGKEASADDKKAIEEFNKLHKDAKEEFNKLKKDVNDTLKQDTNLSDISFDVCKKYLDYAAMISGRHQTIIQCCDKKKLELKHIEQTANAMSARKEEYASIENAFASAMGKGINFGLSVANFYANTYMKCGMACISGCSARARYSKKSGS